jgi:flagellar biosynthesis/type III secretory pathway protein FliH
VVPRSVVVAHDEARAILEAANAEAARILAGAQAERDRDREIERTALRAESDARLAAGLLALREEDERRAERDLERLASTAVVLAERLLGQALAADPDKIVPMARAALREARGARRLVFEANPLDASALQTELHALGLQADAVSVEPHDELARGDLVLRTDLGTLDARLKPQLQRLADALSRARRAE